MARAFKDGNSIKYDATNAKFDTVLFGTWNPGNPISGVLEVATPYTPFDFGTTFTKKADNSVVGNMMDCGECHVGGGMMEYMPSGYSAPTNPQDAVAYDPAKRISLRDAIFGTAVTAFNYFIDVFGDDGLGYEPHNHDGSDRIVADHKPTYAPVQMDYATSGVMEMDCLICHKNDYSWDKRKEAVRTGKFDASRAYGAGFAKSIVSGTQVFYNSTSVTKNANGELTVNLTSLSATPTSNNCVACHMGTEEHKYQVEWKKRGEMWTAGNEVHMGIGCMGCHQRNSQAIATVGTTGIASGLAANAKLGLCDPAKGKASPYEAMWNAVDDKQFKDCTDCHTTTTNTGDSSTYGAANPDGVHAAFGLASSARYGKNVFLADGTRASHLDIIDCTACHLRKSGFSGGAFVDGTGVDLEGRLATHDTENVARQHNNDGVAMHWLTSNPRPGKPSQRKIFAANLLTSFFWRDFNALSTANGGFDANNDGREMGMDPFLPTHIAKINADTNTKSIFETRPTTAAVILNNAGKIKANIEPLLGLTPGTQTIIPKLSFLVVPFKASHNIAKASEAWGSGGCKDCHAENAGFYNGQYPINGKQAKLIDPLDETKGYKRVTTAADTDFTFDSNQVAIYGKVNGSLDTSDAHPAVMNKKGTRSVPVQILSKFDGPYAASVTPNQFLRDIDQSEMLYEDTFQTKNTAFASVITGGAIVPACTIDGTKTSPFYCASDTTINLLNGAVGPATLGFKHVATGTKGWLLMVDVDTDGDGAANLTRTVQVMNDRVGSVDQLVTALGSVGGSYFTVTNGGDKLVLTATDGNTIRITGDTDVAPLGLKGALWKTDPIIRTGVGTFNTRAEYVNYLNSIGAPANAVIDTINGTTSLGGTSRIEITAGTDVVLAATTTGNGTATTYSWIINDALDADGYGTTRTLTGSSVTTQFARTGNYKVTLIATNPAGDTTEDTQTVYVKPVSTDGTGVFNLGVTGPFDTAAPAVSELFLTWTGTPLPTYTKAVIVWGDGSSTTTQTNDLSGSVSHAYKRLKYYSDAKGTTATPTVYNYTTKFYFYNGLKLVAKKEQAVSLLPTSDLVLKERLVRTAVSSNATTINYNLKQGMEVYLVFSVNNKGPGTNTGITVDIPALPNGMTILSGTTAAPVGATKGSYTIGGDWTGIGLAKGQTAYLTLKVKLSDTATVGEVYTVPAAAITASSLPDSVTVPTPATATKQLNITARAK